MRYYSNIAQAATLANAGGVTSGTTTLVLSGTNGMPTQFPFSLRLDPDTANEELVSVTSGAGTVGTPYVITRGFDGTTAKSHTVGAPVVHSGSAIDFREPQEHMAKTTPDTAVHGLPPSAWFSRDYVRKSADQAYNNDATLNDDLHLRYFLEANTDYEIQLYLMCTGLGGNIKTAWKMPVTASGLRQVLGPAEASNNRDSSLMRTGNHGWSTEVKYGIGGLTLWTGIQERAIVRNGATAGEFVLQHAQATSHADLTTLRSESYLIITKIDV
jgi:hypothetical protein